ncbi:MAG: hypothetical protein ABL902_09490 [Gallionella sp.]
MTINIVRVTVPHEARLQALPHPKGRDKEIVDVPHQRIRMLFQ